MAPDPVALIDPRPLIEAVYLVAGAPECERQFLDFALTSLRMQLMSGFKECATPMPCAAEVVERLRILLMAAENDVDRAEGALHG